MEADFDERRVLELSDDSLCCSLSSSSAYVDNAMVVDDAVPVAAAEAAQDEGYVNVPATRSEGARPVALAAAEAYEGYVCTKFGPGRQAADDESSSSDEEDGSSLVLRRAGLGGSGSQSLAQLSAFVLQKEQWALQFAAAQRRQPGETLERQLARALALAEPDGDATTLALAGGHSVA